VVEGDSIVAEIDPSSPLPEIRFDENRVARRHDPDHVDAIVQVEPIVLPPRSTVPPMELLDAAWVIKTPSISLPSGSPPLLSVR